MTFGFELENFRKAFGPRTVLGIARAGFVSGKVTALAGPNGSGKTTLLECLAGLQLPDSGRLLYLGEPLNPHVRKNITLVFQQPYMFSGTVEYNVGYGPRVRGARGGESVEQAVTALRLGELRHRYAKTLSGGEAKRVAIARALACTPETLLLDEPTANIDTENTAIIEDALRALCAGGTTVIFATHSRTQASRIADETFLISDTSLVPFHPDNHYRGFLEGKGREKTLRLSGGPEAFVVTDKQVGEVSFAIPPEDIIVSSVPLESSARNCWTGKLTAVIEDAGSVRMRFDAGVEVVATVTRASHDKMRPIVGDTMCLSFKSSSIRIF